MYLKWKSKTEQTKKLRKRAFYRVYIIHTYSRSVRNLKEGLIDQFLWIILYHIKITSSIFVLYAESILSLGLQIFCLFKNGLTAANKSTDDETVLVGSLKAAKKL